MQMMYNIAQKIETLSITIHKDFGFHGELWVTKDEIFQWIFHEEIQATHISLYIGYLLYTYQDKNQLDRFGFLCPHKIAEIPMLFNQERANNEQPAGVLKEERATERARYIAKAMENAKRNHIFFAPYNSKRHWMLCVIYPFKQTVFWLDPIGGKVRLLMSLKIWIAGNNANKPNMPTKWVEIKFPKQTNNIDCGYYVLRFIHEIIRKGQNSIPEKYYPEFGGSMPYSEDKIDEIRDQWATFVQSFID